MSIIRAEVASFVRTWNVHYIRKQKNRPHVVHGKPYMNYHLPSNGVRNFGLPVDQELLKTLQNDVKDWGMIFDLFTLYDLLIEL
jgi:hypothetical protein